MVKHDCSSVHQRDAEMACPVCNCKTLHVFWELSDVPIFCNLLWTNQNEARNCQKGEVRLAFCGTCGHIANVAFDPNLVDYSQIYENPLDFSPRFQVYTQSLANLLIERYELHDKDIISIGCGNGHFLSTLCEIGNNRGVGFDPSLHERTEQLEVTNKIKLIKDYYSEQYSAYPCDLVVCRHVLEHIHNPKNFLMTLRHALDKFQNTVIFFEVPNAVNIFRNLFVWDIIYEHYSYFTPTSLACLFLVSGFNVSDLSESYESQFLGIHATLSDKAVSDFSKQARGVDRIARSVARFESSYNELVNEWRQKLEQRKDDGQRVVIWGTGSKGVTFLNAFKNSPIEYAVDINPKKQGKFVAGTGQLIVSPKFLRDYKPDFVVVMNPIYGREIQNFLDTLGVSATIEYPLPSVYGK